MVRGEDIEARAARMRDALCKAYGFRAGSLKRAVARAGRRLPRALRAELQTVIAAQGFGGHPKLTRQVSANVLKAAETHLRQHLKTVDLADMRRGAFVSWAANVAFYLLVVFGGLAVWLGTTGRVPI